MPRDMKLVREQQRRGEVVVPNDPDPKDTYPAPQPAVYPGDATHPTASTLNPPPPPPPPPAVHGSQVDPGLDVDGLLEDADEVT